MWLYSLLLVMEGYLAVKWERPGSRYNRVTQYVPEELVDVVEKTPTETKVAVWWPSRKAKCPWNGTLIPEDLDTRLNTQLGNHKLVAKHSNTAHANSHRASVFLQTY